MTDVCIKFKNLNIKLERDKKYRKIITGGYLLASFFMAFGLNTFVAPIDSFYLKIPLLNTIGIISFYLFLPLYFLTTIVVLKTKVFDKKLVLPMIIIIASLMVIVFKIVNAVIGYVFTMIIG